MWCVFFGRLPGRWGQHNCLVLWARATKFGNAAIGWRGPGAIVLRCGRVLAALGRAAADFAAARDFSVWGILKIKRYKCEKKEAKIR